MSCLVCYFATVLFCPAWAVRITTDASEATVDMNVSHLEVEMPHPDKSEDQPALALKFTVSAYSLQPNPSAIGKTNVALCRMAGCELEGNTKRMQGITDSMHTDLFKTFSDIGLIKKGASVVTCPLPSGTAAKGGKKPANIKHLLS